MFTTSPATIPSAVAPTVTATSPVTIPTRCANPGAPTSPPSAVTIATSSNPARTARSASSSSATGTPHTAITASPMNFSITPPYRATTTRHCWKYTESNSRTSSESLLSDNGVNPTRSPNNTEVTRRSATGATDSTVNGTSATTSDTTCAASNAAPHSGQNLPDPADTPHDRHTRGATRRPHSGQNFAPMGTSAAQCEQAAIDNPPAPLRRPPHHEGRRPNVAARKANASVKSRQQRNHPGPTRTQETCSQARDTTHTPTDPTGPPNPIDTAPRQRPDQLDPLVPGQGKT